MKFLFARTLSALLILSGCARVETGVIPLSANESQVLVNAPSRCGLIGAQKAALHQSAIATIKSEFDRFIIKSIQGNTKTIGDPADEVNRHVQSLVIAMFHKGDPAGAGGIDARNTLGPDWQAIVEKGGLNEC